MSTAIAPAAQAPAQPIPAAQAPGAQTPDPAALAPNGNDGNPDFDAVLSSVTGEIPNAEVIQAGTGHGGLTQQLPQAAPQTPNPAAQIPGVQGVPQGHPEAQPQGLPSPDDAPERFRTNSWDDESKVVLQVAQQQGISLREAALRVSGENAPTPAPTPSVEAAEFDGSSFDTARAAIESDLRSATEELTQANQEDPSRIPEITQRIIDLRVSLSDNMRDKRDAERAWEQHSSSQEEEAFENGLNASIDKCEQMFPEAFDPNSPLFLAVKNRMDALRASGQLTPDSPLSVTIAEAQKFNILPSYARPKETGQNQQNQDAVNPTTYQNYADQMQPQPQPQPQYPQQPPVPQAPAQGQLQPQPHMQPHPPAQQYQQPQAPAPPPVLPAGPVTGGQAPQAPMTPDQLIKMVRNGELSPDQEAELANTIDRQQQIEAQSRKTSLY